MRRPHRRALTLAAGGLAVALLVLLRGGAPALPGDSASRGDSVGTSAASSPAGPVASGARANRVPALACGMARSGTDPADVIAIRPAGDAALAAAGLEEVGAPTGRAARRPGPLAQVGTAGARGAGLAPAPVFALYERPDDPAVAILGFDAAAPRDLVLWRVDAVRDTAVPVARTRSASDGGFAIERLLLSTRGVRLVATAAGGDPFREDASPAVEYAPREHPARAVWQREPRWSEETP